MFCKQKIHIFQKYHILRMWETMLVHVKKCSYALEKMFMWDYCFTFFKSAHVLQKISNMGNSIQMFQDCSFCKIK
jgi:hypothetical protein